MLLISALVLYTFVSDGCKTTASESKIQKDQDQYLNKDPK